MIQKPKNLKAVVFCKDCIKLDPNPEDKYIYGLADLFKVHNIVGLCRQHDVYVRINDYCSVGKLNENKHSDSSGNNTNSAKGNGNG